MNTRSLVAAAFALAVVGCTPKPTIVSFTAEPERAELGSPVTLRWEVTDAESLSIAGGPTLSASSTQTVVRPTSTTTYTLVASNSAGETSSAPVTVTVTGRMDATGGTLVRTGSVGRAFAFLLRELGATPPASPVQVEVSIPDGSEVQVTCPAGRVVCLAEYPDEEPLAGDYTATATLGGETVTHTFSVDPSERQAPPGNVGATESSSTTVAVSWTAAPGAISYRVRLLSPGGLQLEPEQIVTGTQVTLTASAPIPDGARVLVEAASVDLSGATVADELPKPNIAGVEALVGAAPEGWDFYDPAAWSGGTLSVSVPDLSATERLAVIVLNLGGGLASDFEAGSPETNVQLLVSGTSAYPKASAGPAPKQTVAPQAPALGHRARHSQLQAQHEASLRELIARGEPRLSKGAPAPVADLPATTSFCAQNGATQTFSRRNATLRHETAHLAIYVDDADLADYSSHEPGIWTSLGDDWEGPTGIYESVTSAFGPESDVDNNDKLIVFFSDELGAPTAGGVLLGYFYPVDTIFARDNTANCTGNRSNGADIFLMNGISNLMAANYSASEITQRIYPDTLAHEFQHLINTNAHCVLNDCVQSEEVWLNEGLSMVAEDIAGFGWNQSASAGAAYLDRLPSSDYPNNYSYSQRSVTIWEGDPIGNYQGVHSLVRYWADRYGEGILDDLVAGTLRGEERTEAVLLTPFPRQLAEWTTALMFSNESFNPSPIFNFTGPNWTPFHTEVGYVNHVALEPGTTRNGSVRSEGWGAYVTGNGTGADVTLTVTSSLNPKPHVVVVRFEGTLPQCSGVVLGEVTGACP